MATVTTNGIDFGVNPPLVKVWDGATWVERPLYYWDGSDWRFAFDVSYFDGSDWISIPDGTLKASGDVPPIMDGLVDYYSPDRLPDQPTILYTTMPGMLGNDLVEESTGQFGADTGGFGGAASSKMVFWLDTGLASRQGIINTAMLVPQPYTILVQTNIDTSTLSSTLPLFSAGAGADNVYVQRRPHPTGYPQEDIPFRMSAGTPSPDIILSGADPTGQNDPVVLVAVFDGAQSEFRMNGVQEWAGDAGSASLEEFRLGAHLVDNKVWRGNYRRIAIYDRVLSSAELAVLEDWLMTDVGLTPP